MAAVRPIELSLTASPEACYGDIECKHCFSFADLLWAIPAVAVFVVAVVAIYLIDKRTRSRGETSW